MERHTIAARPEWVSSTPLRINSGGKAAQNTSALLLL